MRSLYELWWVAVTLVWAWTLQCARAETVGHLGKIGAWPGYEQGAATDVAIVGTTAYVALSPPALGIYDVTDPTHPVRLGGVRLNSADRGTFEPRLHVIGDTVYFEAGLYGLYLVDVHDPTRPVFFGQSSVPQAWETRVAGPNAYVAAGIELLVLNIQNPLAPVLVGSTNLGVCASVRPAGALAYTLGGGVLRVINVGNPARPSLIRSELISRAQSFELGNGFAYVAAGIDGLLIYDLSDPVRPSRVGAYFGNLNVLNVALSGTNAYVSTQSGGLQVLDLTDPSHPTVTTRYTNSEIRRVVMNGRWAYVPDGPAGVQIFEHANSGTFSRVGGIKTSVAPSRITFAGSTALLVGGIGAQPVEMVDISNPRQPTHRSSAMPPRLSVGIEVIENRAYLADSEAWLRILDIGDHDHPVELGQFDPKTLGLILDPFFLDAQRVLSVRHDGNRVYLANGFGGLQILDVTDPTHPTRLGGHTTFSPNLVTDVHPRGDLAYVLVAREGLQAMNVSNPANPVAVGTFSAPDDAQSLHVVGNLAYLVGANLTIVDLHDPQQMTLVGRLPLSGGARRVQVANGRAFLTADLSIMVADVSDPSHPRLLLRHAAEAADLAVRDRTVYAAGPSGLTTYVYREGEQQFLTLPNFGPLTFPGSKPRLTASANSGLPVTYAVLSGPATIEGDFLRFTGPGEVLVRFEQAGDDHYAPVTLDWAVDVLPLPDLTISPATDGGAAWEISWPFPYDMFVLESAEALGPAADWQSVQAPVLQREESLVTRVNRVGQQRYFRLRYAPEN